MKSEKNKIFLFFIIGSALGIILSHYYKTYSDIKSEPIESNTSSFISSDYNTNSKLNIDILTEEKRVINYVKTHKTLPSYYITKSEARKKGWSPEKGNLCQVLPNRAIGGDRFNNREKQLPKENTYFEADINYKCGNRNAERIIYTNNGDVWVTKNHYKTFTKK